MANGTEQLPNIDPQRMASVASLFGAGTTPPAAPPTGAGSMQDYANLAAEQQKQLLGSAPAQEAAKERGAARGYAEQITQTPLPKIGPRVEGGAGFLHNLGQALQIIAMTTKPGREIFGTEGPVYGPGIAKYKATQAGLMGEKQTAQAGAEEAGKEVSALAGVAGRTIYGGSRVESEHERVQQAAIAERDRHNEQLTKLEQNATSLGIKKDALAALKQYHTAYLQSFDRRTAANEDVAMAAVGARQDASAAANIDKYKELHPYLSLLGLGPEPAVPAGGAVKPGSEAYKGGKLVPKGTTVYDPQGKPHSSDGTHPLPKGWSLSKSSKPGA